MSMAIAMAAEASEVKKVSRVKAGGAVTVKGNTFEEEVGADAGEAVDASTFKRNTPRQKTVWAKPN